MIDTQQQHGCDLPDCATVCGAVPQTCCLSSKQVKPLLFLASVPLQVVHMLLNSKQGGNVGREFMLRQVRYAGAKATNAIHSTATLF
jgi:hypothetical protein